MRKTWYKLFLLLAAAVSTISCGGGAIAQPTLAKAITATSASATTGAANITAAPTPSATTSTTPTDSATPTATATTTTSTATSTSTTPTSAPAASSTTVVLDQLAGWQSCDTCAGAGGAGPTAAHSMTQGVVSPSLDGASTQFWLGGSTPYSDVLWHKTVLDSAQAAISRNVHFFVYDLYFYTDNPAGAQSIEWDANQFIDGRSYIFGSQCSYRSKDTWDIWDNANSKWVSTGVSCGALQSNTWNHVMLEFERTTDNQLHYIAMTLNGTRHYLNWYYPSTATTWSGVTVNYQMDGNYQQTNYSTWVDQMKLTYW